MRRYIVLIAVVFVSTSLMLSCTDSSSKEAQTNVKVESTSKSDSLKILDTKVNTIETKQGTEISGMYMASVIAVGGLFILLLVLFFLSRYQLNHHRVSIESLEADLREIDSKTKNELEEFRRAILRLQESKYQPLQASVYTEPKPQEITQPQIISNKELFFATPSGDGFTDSYSTNRFVGGSSKYKLTISSLKPNIATVQFCADDITDSINQPATYIDPICNTEGQNSAYVRHICNIEDGEAELRSGTWVIIKKVKIGYE